MDKRSLDIAYVSAELKARIDIGKYEKEFENAATNPNNVGQNNQAQGNSPAANPATSVQQPSYGG